MCYLDTFVSAISERDPHDILFYVKAYAKALSLPLPSCNIKYIKVCIACTELLLSFKLCWKTRGPTWCPPLEQ